MNSAYVLASSLAALCTANKNAARGPSGAPRAEPSRASVFTIQDPRNLLRTSLSTVHIYHTQARVVDDGLVSTTPHTPALRDVLDRIPHPFGPELLLVLVSGRNLDEPLGLGMLFSEIAARRLLARSRGRRACQGHELAVHARTTQSSNARPAPLCAAQFVLFESMTLGDPCGRGEDGYKGLWPGR